MTYLPLPLVLLTSEDGGQDVHIAPEAFSVAKAEFGEEIKFWQDALPDTLKGKLESVSLLEKIHTLFSCLQAFRGKSSSYQWPTPPHSCQRKRFDLGQLSIVRDASKLV